MKKTIIVVLSLMICICMMSGCTEKKSLNMEKSAESATKTGPKASASSDITEDGNSTAAASDSTEDSAELQEEEKAPTETGYVTLSFEGNATSVTVDCVFLDDDGKLAVSLKGSGYAFDGILIRNGKVIIPLSADILIGDTTYSWNNVDTGSGRLTYHFDLEELPEEVVLYSIDNENEKYVFEAEPFITDSPPAVEENDTSEEQNTKEEQDSETDEASWKELVGVWTGKGEPKGGGSPIDLEITVNADATGDYKFEQAGYKESYPFTLESEDNSFQVNIPADNQLGIKSCKGTYSYEEGKLTLNIRTEFSTGRSFEYTAVCTKKE